MTTPRIVIHDKELIAAVEQAALRGLQQGAAYLHRELQKTIRVDNRKGWWRSEAGEVPHKSGSGPHKEIVREIDEQDMRARVGVTKRGFHLFYMEVGTAAHIIEAVRAVFLRIPWRAEGRGERQPTPDEIARLGLVPDDRDTFTRASTEVVKNGKKHRRSIKRVVQQWVYYRRSVRHPGTAPRPWMIPTFMAHKAKIIELMTQPLAKYTPNFRIGPEPPPGQIEAS